MRISWGISLAIHIGAFLFLLMISGANVPRVIRSVPIQLDVSRRTRPQHVSSSEIVGKSAKNSGERVAAIPLSRLGVSIRGWIQAKPSDHLGDQDPTESFGSGANLVHVDKNITAYRYLYRIIDESTGYPAILKAAAIEGTVSADLYFTAEGEFKRERSEFRASSSYLKVAVIRGIKNALAQSLPQNLRKFERPFRIHCEFTFERTEYDDPSMAGKHSFVSAGSFVFYRNDPHSKLQWRLGPFSGLGPSVSLNPLWFVSTIGGALSKKAKIDPLDSYREDPEW